MGFLCFVISLWTCWSLSSEQTGSFRGWRVDSGGGCRCGVPKVSVGVQLVFVRGSVCMNVRGGRSKLTTTAPVSLKSLFLLTMSCLLGLEGPRLRDSGRGQTATMRKAASHPVGRGWACWPGLRPGRLQLRGQPGAPDLGLSPPPSRSRWSHAAWGRVMVPRRGRHPHQREEDQSALGARVTAGCHDVSSLKTTQ